MNPDRKRIRELASLIQDQKFRVMIFRELRQKRRIGPFFCEGRGTGLNLPHYPRGVARLVALDPEEMLRAKVAQQISAASFPVERVQQAGEHLPFAAGQFDCVVTTLTLCTIADPVSALSEIRRVPQVGVSYIFLEHGRPADARVVRLQDRVNPLWRRCGIGRGCNINRPIDSLIAQGGLRITSLERHTMGRVRSVQPPATFSSKRHSFVGPELEAFIERSVIHSDSCFSGGIQTELLPPIGA